MKLTNTQLKKIISEEITRVLRENLPPSPTDVADAYAGSLTGGVVPTGNEEEPYIQVDRTENPEYDAIVSVLTQLHNPENLTDAAGDGDLIDTIIDFHKRKSKSPGNDPYSDPEIKAVLMDRLKSEVAKLPWPDEVPANAKWRDLEQLLHVLQIRMKPTTRNIAKLKGADKAEAQRLRRQEISAMSAIKTLFHVLQTRAGNPGLALGGQFGVGKKLKFKNIEDWPELDEPPSEEELEDIQSTIGHARLGENRKRRRK